MPPAVPDLRVVEVNTGVQFQPKGPNLVVVSAHPHLTFVPGSNPISLDEQCRQRQKETLRSLAQSVLGSTQPKPDLVVLPEFAIPREFLDEFETYLGDEAWPRDSVVVAGLEPVGPEDCDSVFRNAANSESEWLSIPNNTFANLGLIWTKDHDGKLSRFVQPKISGSAPEQATQALTVGNFCYLFHSDIINFAVLICFDCVSTPSKVPLIQQLLDRWNDLGNPSQRTSIDLLVVPQCNPFAEHKVFLEFVDQVLVPGRPNLRNNDCAIIFANVAAPSYGRTQKHYGRSAIYYRNGLWQGFGQFENPGVPIPATFALETVPDYGQVIRARLREDGPSIHHFRFHIPFLVVSGPGAPRYPLDGASRRLIDGTGLLGPEEIVPPLTKVFSDLVAHDFERQLLGCPEEELAKVVHMRLDQVRKQLKKFAEARLWSITRFLFIAMDTFNAGPRLNPDWLERNPKDWYDDPVGKAFQRFAASCAVLSMIADLDWSGNTEVCTFSVRGIRVVVIDGLESKSANELNTAFLKFRRGSRWSEFVGTTTLLILNRVTRGVPEGGIAEELVDTVEPSAQEVATLPEAIRPKTDSILEAPTHVFWQVDALLNQALDCPSEGDAKSFIEGKLNPCLVQNN